MMNANESMMEFNDWLNKASSNEYREYVERYREVDSDIEQEELPF